MEISHEMTPQGLVVRVQGDLDLHTAAAFREALDRILDQFRSKRLILNLEAVQFIDSTGLGAILGRYKRLAQAGGKVTLVASSQAVRRMLETAGLHRLMGIVGSETAAFNQH